MKRFIRALLAAVCASSALIWNWVPTFDAVSIPCAYANVPLASEGQPNASDCMNFQNEVQGKAVLVHASNRCERKLSCSISYVARCEDNAGHTTSSRAGNQRFTLGANESSELTLSAEHCQQGFRIDGVAWACR